VTLALKLLLAPLLVVGSSLAGRRWGASVAGTLVALPIVAGPILLVTSLELGARFGARAATSSLLGLVSLALFAVVFTWCGRVAWLGRRPGWPVSLVVAWLTTIAADLALARVALPAFAGLIVVLLTVEIATRVLPSTGPDDDARASWPWWDLPGRALATAVLVITVTTTADVAGPRLTGVLAPFPIATSVVAAFALATRGPAAATETLRGTLGGLRGFAVFCFLLAVVLEPAGIPLGFLIATGGALTVQLGTHHLRTASSLTTAPPR
jgi:hypothetical protein